MTSPFPRTAVPTRPDTPGRASAGRTWYRRRAFFVVVGVMVVAAGAVVTDLPRHSSRSTELSGASAVVSQIATDVSPCVYAIHEAFTIDRALTTHTASAADRAHVPAMLRDDQTACSFTNSSIFALSDIEIPGSAAGVHLHHVVDAVTLWVTSDALAAIEAVQTLSAHPTDAAATAALGKARRSMDADRAHVDRELQAVEHVLGAHRGQMLLPRLSLPATPRS